MFSPTQCKISNLIFKTMQQMRVYLPGIWRQYCSGRCAISLQVSFGNYAHLSAILLVLAQLMFSFSRRWWGSPKQNERFRCGTVTVLGVLTGIWVCAFSVFSSSGFLHCPGTYLTVKHRILSYDFPALFWNSIFY